MKKCSMIIILFSFVLCMGMVGCSDSKESYELLPLDDQSTVYYIRTIDENDPDQKIVTFKLDNGDYVEERVEDVLIMNSDHSKLAHATRCSDGTWRLYVPAGSRG